MTENAFFVYMAIVIALGSLAALLVAIVWDVIKRLRGRKP
jgi:hypothetical protein